MELHGNDVIFDSQLEDAHIVKVVSKFWPSVVTEELAENEIAIYENDKAKESWDKEGWSEVNDLNMILMIRNGNQITCVIDDNSKNLPIIKEIIVSAPWQFT